MTFNEGDIVQCINTQRMRNQLTAGARYCIYGVDLAHGLIIIHDDHGSLIGTLASRFTLVTDEQKWDKRMNNPAAKEGVTAIFDAIQDNAVPPATGYAAYAAGHRGVEE